MPTFNTDVVAPRVVADIELEVAGNKLTGSEFAALDGITAGTQAANKAVIADANVNIGVVKATALHIGTSGSETQVNATAAELNMAADSSANSEAVTGANVITAAESGKTFFLNSATGFASTLPAPAAGLRFTFIISTIPTSGNDTIVTNAGANVIEGAADVLSTRVLAANEDSINFVASTCLIGDRIDVISDGTSWFASGYSGATGGVTFTVT